MRDWARTRLGLSLAAGLLAGCTGNPYLAPGPSATGPPDTALAKEAEESRGRARDLDRDNEELSSLLAQERQLRQLSQEQVDLLREQLREATAQVARLQAQDSAAGSEGHARTASSRRPTGAALPVNSSLRDSLPEFDIPGIEVRDDGDVIRVELPTRVLFEPASARLQAAATQVLDTVGRELARSYPRQLIGVEGHTDSDAIGSDRWASHHQLSVGQAMAVFDQLIAGQLLRREQLLVVGHGSNHPVVSNGTAAGRERNRRVELVIYPEQLPRR
jgi:flagellar motor protein MotB